MDNLVFSNMTHRPARTFASVLGVGLGILLLLFIVGLINGSLREQAKREANVGANFFFRPSGSLGQSGSDSLQIPASRAKEIERVEGVELAVPIAQVSVDSSNAAQGKTLVEGIVFDQYAQISGMRIIEGVAFQDGADEAIIDTAYQKQKRLALGDSIKIWERDFKIVGTYEPATGARIKISLPTMQRQLIGADASPAELDKVSAMLIRIKKDAAEDATGERIAQAFPDNQLIRVKELEEIYLNSIPALNVFLDVVIGVAATISGLVILLTMYTTVTERTRQIGILKALGMSNGKIAWNIAQEALLISFFGVATGVLLTYFFKYALGLVTTLSVEIKPSLLLTTLAVGLVGGLVGAIYPAIRAAGMDAVEALSYE